MEDMLEKVRHEKHGRGSYILHPGEKMYSAGTNWSQLHLLMPGHWCSQDCEIKLKIRFFRAVFLPEFCA